MEIKQDNPLKVCGLWPLSACCYQQPTQKFLLHSFHVRSQCLPLGSITLSTDLPPSLCVPSICQACWAPYRKLATFQDWTKCKACNILCHSHQKLLIYNHCHFEGGQTGSKRCSREKCASVQNCLVYASGLCLSLSY